MVTRHAEEQRAFGVAGWLHPQARAKPQRITSSRFESLRVAQDGPSRGVTAIVISRTVRSSWCRSRQGDPFDAKG